jgi:hypothetical protein
MPPIVVWTFAHQTRNDVLQSLPNRLCVSLIVQNEDDNKKKEKSRIPLFFYLLSTINTTDTKKRGSLRFIWGRNDKQQCPIPTTIFNIRTKHTKTRDKTFDSYIHSPTRLVFRLSLLTSHNIPQWNTKRMQPSAD